MYSSFPPSQVSIYYGQFKDSSCKSFRLSCMKNSVALVQLINTLNYSLTQKPFCQAPPLQQKPWEELGNKASKPFYF